MRGQGEGRDRGEQEAGQVAEGMGPKGGEDAQFLLRMMEGMHPPQGDEAVVRPVGDPVAAIHEHEREAEDERGREPVGPGARQPTRPVLEQRGKGHAEQRHQGDDHRHME